MELRTWGAAGIQALVAWSRGPLEMTAGEAVAAAGLAGEDAEDAAYELGRWARDAGRAGSAMEAHREVGDQGRFRPASTARRRGVRRYAECDVQAAPGGGPAWQMPGLGWERTRDLALPFHHGAEVYADYSAVAYDCLLDAWVWCPDVRCYAALIQGRHDGTRR